MSGQEFGGSHAPEVSRTYEVGFSTFTLQFGDILSSDAEVIVSSDDYLLSRGGGVSARIGSAAGHSLAVDVSKTIPLHLGDVVATTAGALSARYVFHAVTLGPARPADEHFLDGPDGQLELVRSLVTKCVRLARSLGVTSVALPALGTGVAGLSRPSVAAGMAEALYAELRDDPVPMSIELFLVSKSRESDLDYVVFFEEFSSLLRAPVRQTGRLPSPRPPMSETAHKVLERERKIVEATNGTPGDAEPDTSIAELQQQVLELSRGGALRLFISYSHEDRVDALRFLKHLQALAHGGHIVWSDHMIPPGTKWEHEIRDALESADIAIFLITASFLSSDYCVGKEWRRAKELSDEGRLVMVPVIIAPCFFKPLVGDIQVLPPGATPVKEHPNEDAAYLAIMKRLNDLVESRYPRR